MRRKNNNRGQAHTLESIAAAILVVSTLLFAVQGTVITPLTTSTSDQHIEEQDRKVAQGVLEHASQTDVMASQILYRNIDDGKFYNATQNGYLGKLPDTPFGAVISETLGDRVLGINIRVEYSLPDGGTSGETVVSMGEPTENAVSVTKSVVLYDDMRITSPNSNEKISDIDTFYIPNLDESSDIYNIVTVELEAWRK